MKSKKGAIALIILLSAIAILLLGIMILLLMNRGNFNVKLFNFNIDTKILYEKEFDSASINELQIKDTSANVFVKESDNDKIKIVVQGREGENVKESFENHKLELEREKTIKNSIVFFWGTVKKEEVNIYLPKNYNKKINIQTTSGDISFINLEEAEVKMKTSSGEIQGGNIKERRIYCDFWGY